VDVYDPDAWSGIVFLASAFGESTSFGPRIGSLSGRLLDGPDIFGAVQEVGPHAPDGLGAQAAPEALAPMVAGGPR
jgi:hypothetical protein